VRLIDPLTPQADGENAAEPSERTGHRHNQMVIVTNRDHAAQAAKVSKALEIDYMSGDNGCTEQQ
jgi:hypothetical protein